MYFSEHPPPHVHALYGEHEVLLFIEKDEIYEGGLPGKQLKIAMKYVRENRENLLSLYNQFNPPKHRQKVAEVAARKSKLDPI